MLNVSTSFNRDFNMFTYLLKVMYNVFMECLFVLHMFIYDYIKIYMILKEIILYLPTKLIISLSFEHLLLWILLFKGIYLHFFKLLTPLKSKIFFFFVYF